MPLSLHSTYSHHDVEWCAPLAALPAHRPSTPLYIPLPRDRSAKWKFHCRSARDSTGKSRARRYHVRSECMTRGPFFSAQQKFRICIPPSRNLVRKLASQEFFLPLVSIQIRAIRWHRIAQSVGISTPICICQAIARGREGGRGNGDNAVLTYERRGCLHVRYWPPPSLPPSLSSLLSPRTSQQWDSGRGSK